jgi:hypothetical protein
MNNEIDHIKQLWQQSSTQIEEVDMNNIIKRSKSLNNRVVIRNLTEYGAALTVAIVFSYMAFHAETIVKMAACVEIVLASIMISVIIFNKGGNVNKLEGQPTKEFLLSYKQNLQRQIKLLGKARYWYVAPLFLGMLIMEGERLYFALLKSEGVWGSLFSLAFIIAFGVFVTYINEVSAVNSLKKDLNSLPDLD